MRVLVTGADGFVGREVVRALAGANDQVTAAARRPQEALPDGATAVTLGDLAVAPIGEIVAGHDAVVHCAGRAHVMRDTAADPLAEFRRVNTAATLNLAEHAARAGVRRLVFLSSVKVNGEATFDRPFRADDRPAPSDPYGQSKLEAEEGLFEIATRTGLQIVVIRPVLVYGPRVKGNFRALVRLVHRQVPLPLGSVQNRRSFVAVENLADLVRVAIRAPAAAGGRFLVSDNEDVSTPELLRRVARAMQTRDRVFRVPVPLIEFGAGLLRRRPALQRLAGNLQVDIGPTMHALDWKPPVRMDDALQRMAVEFLETKR